MVLQRKSYVLLDGQRIVKRGVLEQETHFLPDLTKLVQSQVGDVLPSDANRSRVRFLESDDEPQQYALARAAATQHRQGFAGLHRQTDPVQDILTSKGLMQVRDENNGRIAVILSFVLLHCSLIDRVHICARFRRITGKI